MPTRTHLAILLLAATTLGAQTIYREATLDLRGNLLLRTSSGRRVRVPKLPRQVRYEEPRISPDGRTVGWLATYHYAEAPSDYSDTLVLFRNGRILRTFNADALYWDWRFRNGGRQVAYSIGPTHGGAYFCELRDIATRRRIARWPVSNHGSPPAWAADLRR